MNDIRPGAAVDARPFHLVLTRAAWLAGLRGVLGSGERFATAPFRWHEIAGQRRLLVDQTPRIGVLPRGEDRPPLDDFFVLGAAPPPTGAAGAAEPSFSAAAVAARVRPTRSQTVVAALVDAGGSGAWDGVVWENGVVRPLESLLAVGAGMTRCERAPRGAAPPAALGADALELRASRTRGALGERVWRKTRAAVVTLVGAGRNGSQLAFQLAGLGARGLRIIDPDVLGWENIDAMPGLTAADVGRSKAEALAERLLAFRPDLFVTCLAASALDPAAYDLMRRPADLLATCVDSDTPRAAAALAARQALTTHLDVGTAIVREGATTRYLADVRLLVPTAGCALCVGGLADREATMYELAAPPGALRRGPPREWSAERAGSLATLNFQAVGAAAQLWLDLLAGQVDSRWLRLEWRAGEGMQTRSAAVSAEPNCPVCRPR